TVSPKPDGYYEIISNRSGLALDVDGCLPTNGRNVQVWTGNGADCQRWGFEKVEPGYYRILSKNGLKVLDVAECSTTEGANVQQWQWIGGDCQRWALEPVSQSQPVVGVQSLAITGGIKVYPNPAQEKIAIAFNREVAGNVIISIIDNVGREYFRKILKAGSKSAQLEIETKDFAPGIYILNISGAGINHTEKIIRD